MPPTQEQLPRSPSSSAYPLLALTEDTATTFYLSQYTVIDIKNQWWNHSFPVLVNLIPGWVPLIKAAGVLTKSADNMTIDERLEAHRTMDLEAMDQNIEDAEKRLGIVKFAREEGSRAALKDQSEQVRNQVRETRKGFFESARALEKPWSDMNERDLVVVKTAEKTAQMLGNIKINSQMNQK